MQPKPKIPEELIIRAYRGALYFGIICFFVGFFSGAVSYHLYRF